MRLLLDTNLLIDYFARREPFFAMWKRLRCAAWFKEIELWASAKSFTDVFYVLAKAVPSANLQQAFLESMAFLHVCSIDGEDIASAAKASWPDFEDCLVSVAAQKIGASFILTRDVAGFSQSPIPSKRPDEFFAWLEETQRIAYDDFELDGQTWHCALEKHPYASSGHREVAR